jgi:hypothetical protein
MTKRKQISVLYKGVKRALAELSVEKGLTIDVVRERWERRGRPFAINDNLFLPVGQMSDLQKKTVLYNGEQVDYQFLADKFDVSRNTIGRRARKHGFVLTDAELVFNREMQASMREKDRLKEQEVVAAASVYCDELPPGKTPGWWERENLNPGMRGY